MAQLPLMRDELMPRHCPTCSIEVPPRTGKYCPACGSEMDPAPPPPPVDQNADAAGFGPNSPEYGDPANMNRLAGPGGRIGLGPVPGRPVDGPLAQPMGMRDGSPGDSDAGVSMSDMDRFEQPAIALPLALAAGGALLGALLWAGIAYATGMEIGYVAWAIGGLVGGGMVLGGGRGVGHAGIAAALALVGIFGGKLYGTHMLIEHQLGTIEDMTLTRQTYEQLRAMAATPESDTPSAPMADFARLIGADEQHALTAMAEAEAQQRAALQFMLAPGYTYEKWREEQSAEMRAQISAWQFVKDNLDFLDVIFVLLGLSTAFGIVQRAAVQAA